MRFEQGQTPLNGPYAQAKKEWLETRPGEHCLIRVSARDTNGLYSLVEIVSDPGDGTPSEAEANQYLDVLKDAMSVHLYFPQQNARNGLEVFRDIENRNKEAAERMERVRS